MTQNQLTYWRDKETQRANVAREDETHRANIANEKHNVNVLAETKRHNLAMESIGWDSNALQYLGLSETKRHNISQESINRAQIQESARHNVVSETLIKQNNLATQTETNRHNQAMEQHNTSLLTYDKFKDSLDRTINQQEADASTKRANAYDRLTWSQWLNNTIDAITSVVDLITPGN